MPESAPPIETERLLLRGWREADLDPYADLAADPEVNRFLGDPMDREQAWRSIATFIGHWQLRGYGLWAVERKSDQQLLGRVGLWRPEGWPGIELGWTLARHAWGSGYATEGARAAMSWGWDTLGLSELISVIHPQNAKSMQVAERIGMNRDREYLLRGSIPTVIYKITRST